MTWSHIFEFTSHNSNFFPQKCEHKSFPHCYKFTSRNFEICELLHNFDLISHNDEFTSRNFGICSYICKLSHNFDLIPCNDEFTSHNFDFFLKLKHPLDTVPEMWLQVTSISFVLSWIAGDCCSSREWSTLCLCSLCTLHAENNPL